MDIFETEYWKVVLNTEDQTYLGRCVVVCKRSVGSLSELTDDEWLDFAKVAKRLEGACRAAFGATPFNWGCLMNHAYRVRDPRPQVHWHFRPRYAKPVQLGGETFTDEAFGSHYLRGTERKVSGELTDSIVSAIRKRLR
jgi:diadenosine tetraphosphate (Ap4A) HIT family hydrolase